MSDVKQNVFHKLNVLYFNNYFICLHIKYTHVHHYYFLGEGVIYKNFSIRQVSTLLMSS